jgi:hypothetical protein
MINKIRDFVAAIMQETKLTNTQIAERFNLPIALVQAIWKETTEGKGC